MIICGIEITKLPAKIDRLEEELRDLRYEVAQQRDSIKKLLNPFEVESDV